MDEKGEDKSAMKATRPLLTGHKQLSVLKLQAIVAEWL